jgi:lysophospholipase L1-like esterase
VILYLGTNDLAERYNLSAEDVASACASLVPVVRYAQCGRDGQDPVVMLVCPPPILATGPEAELYERVAVKSRGLGRWFAELAPEVGAELLDLDGVVRYAEQDPIHLDAAAHRMLAEVMAARVAELVPARANG